MLTSQNLDIVGLRLELERLEKNANASLLVV